MLQENLTRSTKNIHRAIFKSLFTCSTRLSFLTFHQLIPKKFGDIQKYINIIEIAELMHVIILFIS